MALDVDENLAVVKLCYLLIDWRKEVLDGILGEQWVSKRCV